MLIFKCLDTQAEGVFFMTTREALNHIVDSLSESELKVMLSLAKDLRTGNSNNPFVPKAEKEFMASIDRGIADIDAGRFQDSDDVIKELDEELGLN